MLGGLSGFSTTRSTQSPSVTTIPVRFARSGVGLLEEERRGSLVCRRQRPEVVPEYVVAVTEEDRSVDVWFRLGDGVGESEALGLGSVLDWSPPVFVAEGVDHLLAAISRRSR